VSARLPAYALYGARRPAPVPTQIVPASGPASGGTIFGVIGTDLGGSTGVTFAGNPATEINPLPGGAMVQGYTPVAPLLEPGLVEVVLIHPTASVIVPGGYTYTAAEEAPELPEEELPEEELPEEPDEPDAESEGGEA
jgi:hypothetical protein